MKKMTMKKMMKVMMKKALPAILTLSILFSIISPVNVKAQSLLETTTTDDKAATVIDKTTTIGLDTKEESTDESIDNNKKDLPKEDFNSDTLTAMGFETQQQVRKDPDNNEIDLSQNPLGSSNKALVQNLSLAGSGFAYDKDGKDYYYNRNDSDDNLYGIYDVLRGGEMHLSNSFMPRTLISSESELNDWRKQPKVMTSADLSQDGFEEVITAVLMPAADNTFGLQLVIENYNQGKASSEAKYQLISSGLTLQDITPNSTSQSLKYKKHFRIAACKGKVAILIQRDLYNFDITYSASQNQYNIKQDQKFSFTEENPVAPIANKENPMIDLEGADINNDGLSELLVTTGSDVGTKDAYLLAYLWERKDAQGVSSTDFNTPLAKQSLSEPDHYRRLKFAGVTVGNAVGRGTAVIVGGYDHDSELRFMNLTYDLKTNAFTCSTLYYTNSKTSDNDKYAMVLPEINCASFGEQNASIPQYILCNDQIYRFNSARSHFEEQFDISRSNQVASYPELDIYDTAMIKYTMDYGVDSTAKEAAAIICQDRKGITYLVYLVPNTEEDITFNVYSDRGLFTESDYRNFGRTEPLRYLQSHRQFFNPAICAACVKDRSFSLEFLGASFTMTDPEVVAVLGASPYYKELENEYGNGLGNVSTTFGTGTTKETESGLGTSVSISATIGFEVEVSAGTFVQTKIGGVEGGVTLSSNLSWEWSQAEATTLRCSFSSVNSDMVVLTSVPFDLYKYRIHDPGQEDDGKITIISIPEKPQTSLMNLDDYNELAKELNAQNPENSIALVTDGVLKHTAGDPRTYASNIGDIIGAHDYVSSKKVLGVGTGDGFSELGIAKDNTNSKSFEGEIGIDTYLKVTVGSVFGERHYGGGFNTHITTSITNSTEISGSVANIPSKYKDYNFSWELAGYKYNLTPGSNNSCYVVNYFVHTGNTIPPSPPQNVQLLNYKHTSARLTWDAVKGATEYRIYRSTKKSFNTNLPYAVINQTTDGKWLFNDTKLNPNQQYYYAISAVKVNEGRPTEVFPVPVLVEGIDIKTPPKLEYKEGEALDLSTLVLQYNMTDNTQNELPYQDLYKRGILVNIPDGRVLGMEDDGVSIIITDPVTNLTVITDPLVITQSASTVVDTSKYDISSYFKVGGIDNMQSLQPNTSLSAYTTIKNKQNTPQKVLVAITLYDQNGSMIQCDYTTREIQSGATEIISVGNFTTPADVKDYEAKILVFEGSDFDTSSLMPITRPMTIRGN